MYLPVEYLSNFHLRFFARMSCMYVGSIKEKRTVIQEVEGGSEGGGGGRGGSEGGSGSGGGGGGGGEGGEDTVFHWCEGWTEKYQKQQKGQTLSIL